MFGNFQTAILHSSLKQLSIMKAIEFLYQEKNIVHVIQAKISQNKKIGIGYVIQTYHFSIDQVKNIDIKQDGKNCLDCPLSYSNKGGCYTHKGMQLMGLKSMLKRLNKLHESGKIELYNQEKFDAFVSFVKNTYPVDLTRLGAYGEAVLMRENVISELVNLGKKSTGYTHQWKKDKSYAKYFMASTHNESERKQAHNLGYRSFIAITKNDSVENSANCPASKESSKNLTCILCGLCNGKKTNNKKDVHILQH